MSDHLPECLRSDPKFGPVRTICICDRLRQAEQRVTERLTFPQMAAHSYNKGYAAGVQAARDAVAALVPDGLAPGFLSAYYVKGVSNALAAIDALKEES